MFKRIRWITLGYLLGVVTSIVVQARVRRLVNRYVPARVRQRTHDQIAAWGADVRAAWVEGRAARSTREQELRERFGIDDRPRAATG